MMVWAVLVAPLVGSATVSAATTSPADALTGASTTGATTVAGAAALQALEVGPTALAPAFAADVSDYTTRCGEGLTELTFSAAATAGGEVTVDGTALGDHGSTEVAAWPDQLIQIDVVGADGADAHYWVRCLPPDFPPITVSRPGTPSPGWYLVASGLTGVPGESPYAMVLDDHGVPVWYQKTPAPEIDVRPGDDGLIGWGQYLAGGGLAAPEKGGYEFRDLDGTLQRTIKADGLSTDPHDLVVLPNGNHLVLANELVGDVDLRSLGERPADVGTIAAGRIQEVSPDGQLLWEWRAEDHIGLDEVTHPETFDVDGEVVVDVHHFNSMELGTDGDLIISARHLNAVYDIDLASGAVRWKLGGAPVVGDGGRALQILDDPFGGPVMQHDARLLPDGHLTLFDNHSGTTYPSRSVEYALDLAAGTARLVWEHRQPQGVTSGAMGSSRRQPEGSTVIGWGLTSTWFTEVAPEGAPLLEVRSSGPTYRAVKVPVGTFDRGVLRATAGRPPGGWG